MPIFLWVILYIFLEIYAVTSVWRMFGPVHTFFALFAGAILGAGIMRSRGRYILRQIQEATARGETPNDQLLHGMIVFLGGLLIMIPGFVSDAVGLLLLLPGSRHLVVAFIKRRWKTAKGASNFRVFTFGGGMGGFSGGFSTSAGRPQQPPQSEWMRDVSPKVIDVQPISSEKSGDERAD